MTCSPSRSAAGALTLALAAGIAGCGAAVDNPAATGTPLAEPVTVTHQFGTTVVEATPERIVTTDLQWTDVVLAMGLTPVGYTVTAGMPEAGVPWQDMPGSAEALPSGDGLPIDEIAELNPDLILGTYSIGDEETYQLLSGIAPTLATIGQAQVSAWPDLVELAGQFLADPERAAQVTDAVAEELATTAAELPGLAGETFALAQYVVGDAMYIVADEQDGSSVFFQQLGMELYPPVVAEGAATGAPRISVSTERADLLGAGLLAFFVNGGDESDLADIPGFAQLPGTVAVLDFPTIVALNTPSPLSIPHALAGLRPYLEDAAGAATT